MTFLVRPAQSLILSICIFTGVGIALATPSVSHASGFETSSAGPFGLGIQLGAPSGISGKYWLNHEAALQGLLAFDINSYVLYSMDYIYHYPGALSIRDIFTSRLTPYFGVGGLIVIANSTRDSNREYLGRHAGDFGFGVRVPLGIEWRPSHPPLGVYVEIAPGLALAPETTGFVQGGIGIRYYF